MSNGELAMYAKALGESLNDAVSDAVGEEVASIVKKHALGAAASGFAATLLPGAGSTAALVAAVGFIWSMYYRINKCLGLKLSKVVLKSLASAVLTNLAGSVASIIGATVISAIPIVNNVATVLMAGVDYAVVLVSGVVYLKLLTNIFKAGKNIEEMTESDLKEAMESVVKEEDVSQLIKDARDEYKNARKSGEVTGKETIELEKEEEEE